jgi:excisionase family DNA binding protein
MTLQHIDKLYTVEQIAEIFSVTPSTVRIWLRNEELKGFKLNGRGPWRIREEDAVNFASEKYGSRLR